MPPPSIQTYHCICTSLLLSSTHTLNSLPQRSGLDSAIILPLPSSPPPLTNPLTSSSSFPEEEQEQENDLPPSGYTVLLGLVPDRKTTIIRREDGFEKRVLYRCSRCKLVVGYELQNANTLLAGGAGEDIDLESGKGKGKGKEEDGESYTGKVLYVLPAGIMSTEFMVQSGKEGGKRLGEEDIGIRKGVVAVFE